MGAVITSSPLTGAEFVLSGKLDLSIILITRLLFLNH